MRGSTSSLMKAASGAALAALALLCMAQAASGRDWYVTVAGSDAAAGTLADPTSLFGALGRAGAGDSVILRAGQYDLTRAGILNHQDMTLAGYPDERPVLSMAYDNASLGSVVRPYANGCTVRGLEIAGGYYYGVKMDYPDCVVEDCRIRDTGRDAVKIARPADRCRIENCEIWNTGRRDPSNAEGIDNVACDDVVVRGCYIHDTATNGLYMKGGAARCIIEKNVVADTGGHGIMLGQSTDQALMTSVYECRDSIARNNIVLRSSGSGLAFEAASNCRLYNNTLYDVATTFGGGISVHANEHNTPSKDVHVNNNIIFVTSTRPMFFVHPSGLATAADMACDYNLYFRPSGNYSFWFEPSSLYLNGINAWRAATPYDAHSLVGDPQFTFGAQKAPPKAPAAPIEAASCVPVR